MLPFHLPIMKREFTYGNGVHLWGRQKQSFIEMDRHWILFYAVSQSHMECQTYSSLFICSVPGLQLLSKSWNGLPDIKLLITWSWALRIVNIMMVRVQKLTEILSGRIEFLMFQRLHALVLASVLWWWVTWIFNSPLAKGISGILTRFCILFKHKSCYTIPPHFIFYYGNFIFFFIKLLYTFWFG